MKVGIVNMGRNDREGRNMTFGPPIRKPLPSPPEWVPSETKGIERNTCTGALRTNLPMPPLPVPEVVLSIGEAT